MMLTIRIGSVSIFLTKYSSSNEIAGRACDNPKLRLSWKFEVTDRMYDDNMRDTPAWLSRNLEGKTRQGNPVVESDDGGWSPIYTMKNEVVVISCKP